MRLMTVLLALLGFWTSVAALGSVVYRVLPAQVESPDTRLAEEKGVCNWFTPQEVDNWIDWNARRIASGEYGRRRIDWDTGDFHRAGVCRPMLPEPTRRFGEELLERVEEMTGVAQDGSRELWKLALEERAKVRWPDVEKRQWGPTIFEMIEARAARAAEGESSIPR